jgi:hypothetical protein
MRDGCRVTAAGTSRAPSDGLASDLPAISSAGANSFPGGLASNVYSRSVTSDESDLGELRAELDEIQKWAKVVPDWFAVHPGSSLAGDDAATSPHQLSHAASHAIAVAVDHLDCLRTLIDKARTVHAFAPFGLLRPALEGAAIAIWLLAPPSRDERVTRCVRLAKQDITDSEEAKAIIKASSSQTREQRLDRLRTIVAHRKIDLSSAFGRYGAEGVVRAGAEAAAPGLGNAATVLWKVCSGVAHARTSGTLAVSQWAEAAQTSENVILSRVTANERTIVLAIKLVVGLVRRAFSLYEDRAACHLQPASVEEDCW